MHVSFSLGIRSGPNTLPPTERHQLKTTDCENTIATVPIKLAFDRFFSPPHHITPIRYWICAMTGYHRTLSQPQSVAPVSHPSSGLSEVRNADDDS